MRSIATIPFSTGGKYPLGGLSSTVGGTVPASDKFGDWGVKGVRKDTPGYWGMLGVACNYLDLFARKPKDESEANADYSYNEEGGDYAGLDLGGPFANERYSGQWIQGISAYYDYRKGLDDDDPDKGYDDNFGDGRINYGDSEDFWALRYYQIQTQEDNNPNWAVAYNYFFDTDNRLYPYHSFAGSAHYCCANSPIYAFGDQGLHGFDQWTAYDRLRAGDKNGGGNQRFFDLCQRNSANNWDFPNNGEHPQEPGISAGRADLLAGSPAGTYFKSVEEVRDLKQSSIHHHTCADIRNATHFSGPSLEAEEWDMFVEARLQTSTPKTYVDTPKGTPTAETINRLACPISNTANNPMQPGCYSRHVMLINFGARCGENSQDCIENGVSNLDIGSNFDTNLYNWKVRSVALSSDTYSEGSDPSSAYADSGPLLRNKNDASSGTHCGYEVASSGYLAANPDMIGNVNWGKVNKSDEESYTPEISPYELGKRDGILECGTDEAYDLLFHGFLKNAESCMPFGKHLLQASACQNPNRFGEWRKISNTGFTIATDTASLPLRASNGREMPLLTEACQCYDSEDEDDQGASLAWCSCGALARTSRMVIAGTTHTAEFKDKNPHSPDWIVGSAKTICNVPVMSETNSPKDRGNVPLRACAYDALLSTPLWKHWQWNEDAANFFRKEDKPIKFLKSSGMHPFEITSLAKCANNNDCDSTIDLSVLVSGDADRTYLMYRVPASGSCYPDSTEVAISASGIVTTSSGRRACVPIVNGDTLTILENKFGSIVNSVDEAFDGGSRKTYYTVSADANITDTQADELYYCSIGACAGVLNSVTLRVDITNADCTGEFERLTINATGTCFGGETFSFVVDNQRGPFVRSLEITEPLCVQRFDYLLFKTCTSVGYPYTETTSSEYNGLYREGKCGRSDLLELDYAEPWDASGVQFMEGACPRPPEPDAGFGVEVLVGESAIDTVKYCIDRGMQNMDGSRVTISDPSEVQSAVVLYDAYRHHDAGQTAGQATQFYLSWERCGAHVNVNYNLNIVDTEIYYREDKVFEKSIPVFNTGNLVPFPKGRESMLIELRAHTWRDASLEVPNFPFARSVTAADVASDASLHLTFGAGQQCLPGRRTALIGARGASGSVYSEFTTDSPVVCYEACIGAAECVAIEVVDITCRLYSRKPTIVEVSDFAIDVSVAEALTSGMETIIFCLDQNATVVPRLPPLAENGDSGCEPEYIGVVPNCLRSECDGKTHRAVPLNPREVGCKAACREFCGELPHRSLQPVLNLPNFTTWGTLEGIQYPDYRLKTKLLFSETPHLDFWVNSFPFNETSPAKFTVRLPALATTCESTEGSLEGETFSGFVASMTANEGEDNEFTVNTTVANLTPTMLHVNLQLSVTFTGWPFSVSLNQDRTLFRLKVYPFDTENHGGAFLMPGAVRTFCNETEFIQKERDRLYYRHLQGIRRLEFPNVSQTDEELEAATTAANEKSDEELLSQAIIGDDKTPKVEVFHYCRTNTDDFHICVPHTRCTEDQYKARDGDLHSDTVCVDQPLCTWGEYVSVNGTATTARECKAHPVCKETETSDPADDPSAQEGDIYTKRNCVTRRDCTENEFRNEDGKCSAISTCTQTQYVFEQNTRRSDNVCRDWAAECTAVEYQTAEPTGTSDRKCTSATLCRTDEYVRTTASETEDRTCSPILKCDTYEIETTQGTIESQTVCKSILQWSSVWVYTAVGVGGFILAAVRGWGVYAL